MPVRSQVLTQAKKRTEKNLSGMKDRGPKDVRWTEGGKPGTAAHQNRNNRLSPRENAKRGRKESSRSKWVECFGRKGGGRSSSREAELRKSRIGAPSGKKENEELLFCGEGQQWEC